MSFQSFFRAFALAVVTALSATGAQAASHMALGAIALAPEGYVALCERQPLACGADAAQVLAGAARADAERQALLGGPAVGDALGASPAEAVADVAMTPELLAALKDVNARVNRAIRPIKDNGDTWTLPLAEGRRAGDCEDYVMEKIQALVGRGVPRSALNIAVAVTPWGETHAVLVVTTTDGEFVLDNLNPDVRPWADVPYKWGKRQVAGRAFQWAMVRKAASAAASGD
jgi:predicted transglutaminase-like cysteine proteinase